MTTSFIRHWLWKVVFFDKAFAAPRGTRHTLILFVEMMTSSADIVTEREREKCVREKKTWS